MRSRPSKTRTGAFFLPQASARYVLPLLLLWHLIGITFVKIMGFSFSFMFLVVFYPFSPCLRFSYFTLPLFVLLLFSSNVWLDKQIGLGLCFVFVFVFVFVFLQLAGVSCSAIRVDFLGLCSIEFPIFTHPSK